MLISDVCVVDIIQYMHPHGRTVKVTAELPIKVQIHYQDMLLAGCRFEAEVLMTGEVSVTITDDEKDIDCEVISNDFGVLGAMTKILERRAWEHATEN